jgi:hypothetical protein
MEQVLQKVRRASAHLVAEYFSMPAISKGEGSATVNDVIGSRVRRPSARLIEEVLGDPQVRSISNKQRNCLLRAELLQLPVTSSNVLPIDNKTVDPRASNSYQCTEKFTTCSVELPIANYSPERTLSTSAFPTSSTTRRLGSASISEGVTRQNTNLIKLFAEKKYVRSTQSPPASRSNDDNDCVILSAKPNERSKHEEFRHHLVSSSSEQKLVNSTSPSTVSRKRRHNLCVDDVNVFALESKQSEEMKVLELWPKVDTLSATLTSKKTSLTNVPVIPAKVSAPTSALPHQSAEKVNLVTSHYRPILPLGSVHVAKTETATSENTGLPVKVSDQAHMTSDTCSSVLPGSLATASIISIVPIRISSTTTLSIIAQQTVSTGASECKMATTRKSVSTEKRAHVCTYAGRLRIHICNYTLMTHIHKHTTLFIWA